MGASTTITIQTTVTDNATTAFTNTAAANGGGPVTASCGGCGSEVIINNNTSSVTTSVEGSAIDLSVGDITDNPDPAGQGAEVTYTTTITNGGSQNALTADGNQVVIRADLPNVGVTLGIFAASEGFNCVASNANAVVTCTGDLLAGASTTLDDPVDHPGGGADPSSPSRSPPTRWTRSSRRTRPTTPSRRTPPSSWPPAHSASTSSPVRSSPASTRP